MADAYMGQIALFAFDIVPSGWAPCNGQLLQIASNQTLFAVIGVFYGGDGRTTFGLPNLKGRVPLGQGQGAELSPYDVGQSGGEEDVTLVAQNLPAHSHNLVATTNPGTTRIAADAQLARSAGGSKAASYTGNYLSTAAPNTQLSRFALSLWGGTGRFGATHNNMQPYVTLNFCICINGQYPTRP